MGRLGMTPEAAPTVAGLPFVGRDAALAEFDGVLAAAGQGRGALVLIRGEAGIGKTTLAARAADRAAARGIATRFGACWLEGGAPAFWPWAQLLDAHARDLDGDELQRLAGDAAPALATISSALATRLPAAEARPGAQDPATARFALLAAVAGFWLRAADQAPLLLALEDLHWADVASVLLLAQLGSELADHPLVVVGTLRGDEVADDRLRDALAELNRASPLVLELGGLSAGALAELVRHAGEVVTREDLIARVWDENWFGSTKTLDVHVGWLRRKLGDDPASPGWIDTVRGVGYRFREP